MSLSMRRVMQVACFLGSSSIWPTWSWALGLGEIHLNSALNEPMSAQIDLIAAAPDELTGLRAALASREAFTRYGIDKPPFLSSLTFKVGKAKDGHDVLFVRSSDAIPEPFVTFLVDVNWARGRLMREYTVLLDPPVYTPGENPSTAAQVAAPATTPVPLPAPLPPPPPQAAPVSPPSRRPAAPPEPAARSEIRVARGDTLSRIARGLEPESGPGQLDQTMIALYRSNPSAFGGNINVLREGSVLRVPGADQLAMVNQRDAANEVRRQMEAWRTASGAAVGHLRLVTPGSGGNATGTGSPSGAPSGSPSGSGAASAADNLVLKSRVKELEGELAESKRLIEIRNNELASLQQKLSSKTPTPTPTPTPAAPPSPVPAPMKAAPPAVAVSPPTPPAVAPTAAISPPPVAAAPPPTSKPSPAPPPTPVDNSSWIDWVAENWWVPVALLFLVLVGLAVTAVRRRREQSDDIGSFNETDVADSDTAPTKLAPARRSTESFVVEESGQHPVPDVAREADRFGDTADLTSPDDTLSTEHAVSLDQGDPLAEADFHMAYGLYDQAADLVRIALEREPDRRDLRLKLLEIYFVWGNKDAFLQTAKGLEATRDRAPAGEWDKILIMGKQICPDEPMFASSAGAGRGAGALVDLNLEGGENRVDIDLYGDPEGERSSLDRQLTEGGEHPGAGEAPSLSAVSRDHLDFTLDAPERGADDSPTREMPPRDGPTVESELMNYNDANLVEAPFYGAPNDEPPTVESPALRTGGDLRDRLAAKLPPKADQTAEVSIDDLGLDLDHLEATGSLNSIPSLGDTNHPPDAPTMVAGLDDRSRRLMAQADQQARGIRPRDDTARENTLNERDRDLTELERELEASFVAELDSGQNDGQKTTVLGAAARPTAAAVPPVAAPPREAAASRDTDVSPTQRFAANEFADFQDLDKIDMENTSKLRGINADSIDLDLDRLASALGSGDTVEQPRAAEDLFSNEVFDAAERTGRNKVVDLDVGEAMVGVESPTNKLQAQTNKLKPVDLGVSELEPVTMSEVGTKLDLARAYMDMGDPEGARSILEEVVQEGSASQKQEASRLIESLPG